MAVLEQLGQPPKSTAELTDMAKKLNQLRFTEVKLIKASDTARAAIMVASSRIDLSASDENNATTGISVIEGGGTVIRGPIGITGTPSDIRIAGLWKFNDVLLSCAPSTILTPIPVLRFSLPMENLIEFKNSLAVAAGILG